MKHNVYTIDQFRWDATTRTLQTDYRILWDIRRRRWPLRRFSFLILNPATGNHRRFQWVSDVDSGWLFQSEDSINCIIQSNP